MYKLVKDENTVKLKVSLQSLPGKNLYKFLVMSFLLLVFSLFHGHEITRSRKLMFYSRHDK